MKSPLPFIVEKEGKLVLNEEVMSIIEKANNPKFISFYGTTRFGKSTTLNQLIMSNKESWSYIRNEPFKAANTLESITSGCDIYGPIKFSELKAKHPKTYNSSTIKEDFDIFFCDTEGIGSLNDFNKSSIPGILIILQICTLSVFMVREKCIDQDVKEICSLMQFTKVLNKDLKLYPKVGVYIAKMLTGNNIEKENSEVELDDDNIISQAYGEFYRNSIEKQKALILNRAKERYKDLTFENNDLEIIAGGPYFEISEPSKDINLVFYWQSIHEIYNTFLKFYKAGKNKKKTDEEEREKEGINNVEIDIVKLIRKLFEIFSKIEKLDDDFNLRTFLITYLEKEFDEYSQKQFTLKLEKIKEDIQSNFLEYMEILNSDKKAEESLNDCLEEDLREIYMNLIPKKVKSFKDLSKEQYRKFIKDQIDSQFESICKNILSKENIESLIKDIKEMIIRSEFREDIDMDQINNTNIFWENMYEKNKVILNYFKETKENILNNLKENFISEINKIFQDLLSNKISWTNYLKDSLVSIQKEINQNYSEMFKKCNYQEDIEIYISKSSDFFNSIFPSIKEKYFNTLSESRLNEVKEKAKQICDEEYNKLLENKLPIWSNIKEDINSRIKENIEAYFTKIFKGAEFKDQIEPNLGRKDVIENIVPLEVKENPQIKGNKKDEIKNLIDLEIDKAVQMFNEKRENLPLFSEFADNLIKISTEKVDNKMKEIINSFYYLEDKKIFNSDYIFSLLTEDQKIYKNCSSKIKELNVKLRELCDDKSKEYELLIQRTKPEWNKIKSEKISTINDICTEYIRKIFSNADFQDDVRNIDKDELKKMIIESNGFYNGIQEDKKHEIINEIDKIISQTEDKINAKKSTLESWNTVKTQLIQKAYIEMTNKSKSNLNTKDSSKIIEILVSHIDTIPKFYDPCKTEQRKSELISELKSSAKPIADDYIKKVEEEERRRQEEEERERRYRRMLEEAEERRREAERRAEYERQRREQEERRRRQEEENRRRRQEEENRRRREEEDRRRREEEDRRRREQEHRNHIEDLANRVLRGEFGNGKERERRLGGLFHEVQNKVNEKLGCGFRYK